jgi:hypothetical protein
MYEINYNLLSKRESQLQKIEKLSKNHEILSAMHLNTLKTKEELTLKMLEKDGKVNRRDVQIAVMAS